MELLVELKCRVLIKKLVLPKSLEKIAEDAFDECDSLEIVYVSEG